MRGCGGCEVAMSRGCEVAGCEFVMLRGCEVVGYEVARLRGCEFVRLTIQPIVHRAENTR